jgi:hypothetical protein
MAAGAATPVAPSAATRSTSVSMLAAGDDIAR